MILILELRYKFSLFINKLSKIINRLFLYID